MSYYNHTYSRTASLHIIAPNLHVTGVLPSALSTITDEGTAIKQIASVQFFTIQGPRLWGRI
jgi:hypothetical protein